VGTTIKDLEKQQQNILPKVESEKVSRFLQIRYKLRKTKEKTSQTLDELAVKLDPRANQEDYLRRWQRLKELVDSTKEDPALGHDKDLKTALDSAENTLDATNLAVATAQSKNQRPDYGSQRDLLKGASDKLESAIATATKRVDKLNDNNPTIFGPLSTIGELLDDAATKATADQISAWRQQFSLLTASFYGPRPDLKKVQQAAGQLATQINTVLLANTKRAEAIRSKSAQLTNAMATSTLPIDKLAPVDSLIKRATRESSALDFSAADQSLKDAEALLPRGNPQPPPKIRDVEVRRIKLHQAAFVSIPTVKPGQKPPPGAIVSPPARERVVALLHRLDDLRPLCQQPTDEVAVEALRRIQACELEFQQIKDKDAAAKDFADDKKSYGDFIAEKIKYLKGEIAEQPMDGTLSGIEGRLLALEENFKANWSKLMVQSELDESGLLREATALVEAYDDWKSNKESQGSGPQTWQQDFYGAADRLQRATEEAREKNVGLLQRFGLLGAMPALVIKGGSLITGSNPDQAEQQVRAITRQILDTVNVVIENLKNTNPHSLDALVREGEQLAETFNQQIDEAVEKLESEQPGSKMQKVRKLGKFFKEDAFKDDGERAVRIEYGATLKNNLDGLVTLLHCKDPTAVETALDDIKALEWQVRDYKAMAANAKDPSKKDGSAPPPFAELQKRIKAIQKKIEENTKDQGLGTRVDTLKGWSDAASALSEEMGQTDPRELETRIGTLEREILETTRKDRIEIDKANRQIEQIMQLVMRVMDARKKGSPLLKDFGPLLAALQREGEAMRKNVSQWKITDAGFDDYKKDVESILNANRPQDETNALTKKSSDALKEDHAVEAARRALLKLHDADLKLWRERFEQIGEKNQKKTCLKLVDDLTKEAERALDSLAENRDAEGAQAMVKSCLRELSEASAGQGDKLTARANLEELDLNWGNAVASLNKALNDLDKAVTAAANGGAQDVVNATKALHDNTIRYVAGLFDPKLFAGSIKGLMSEDAGVRATSREAALSEVRRLRRVIESDGRIRTISLDNPFKVPIPFSEISSRLFDIEVNVTRARGA
jgi:hypothetical protein